MIFANERIEFTWTNIYLQTRADGSVDIFFLLVNRGEINLQDNYLNDRAKSWRFSLMLHALVLDEFPLNMYKAKERDARLS